MRYILCIVMVIGLSGCNAAQRISEIGQAPKMSDISIPSDQDAHKAVQMPMPRPTVAENNPNSLWQPGARAFFKDQRAARVGDILTVKVTIDEKAEMDNETKRNRTGTETADLKQLFNTKIPTKYGTAGKLLDADSTSTTDGKGTIKRSEKITLQVAAVITQILPNGNFVLQGKQEMRVNFELRELMISGVIRPEDISPQNTISYEQIAEARISYGGRGQVSDIQQPRYGQQLFDIIFPF